MLITLYESNLITTNGLSEVKGFYFSGLAISQGEKNLGLVYSSVEDTKGVAIYTRSDIVAAPVEVSREMDDRSFVKRAILINSGSANAFTGKQGKSDAIRCCLEVAQTLKIKPEEVYIGSTGVIGQKLPMDNIVSNMSCLVDQLGINNEESFIEAIMTTDTKVKKASVKFDIDGVEVNIAACAKGSGMIMPDMATMLSVITTDADITSSMMKKALSDAARDTYNCITVDGDTSTNDTIFFLANGLAANKKIEVVDKNYDLFYRNLFELMEHMAKRVVDDGEGITKFITIDVINTQLRENAKKVAFSIANSPLVKTALFGENLNWGRILMAIGKAQTGMDCSIIEVYLNGFKIIELGEPIISDSIQKKVKESLKNRDIEIKIDFRQGNEKIRVWTCDFSYEYIKINADYVT